jgi:hypothetical protein
MSHELWAVTAYFNPMHWRRRLVNYRAFRERLRVPLVAVELGYDGQFDLRPGDAELLLQDPGKDVMWQKERLLNLALEALPAAVTRVACLDSDVILERSDIWRHALRALDESPLVQLFSQVYYLPADELPDFAHCEQTRTPAAGFAWLRQQGHSTLDLCNPVWTDPGKPPPVPYGLAWAFRRELFAGRGLYDAWVVGGATRLHCFAADGLWREAATAMRFHGGMVEHYRRWAEGFHAEVRGNWGYVPGAVAHLWHGEAVGRKYRQRYEDFARFGFDPTVDLARDRHGAWRWNSDKPEMHQYLRDYFAGRQEDGPGGASAEASATGQR